MPRRMTEPCGCTNSGSCIPRRMQDVQSKCLLHTVPEKTYNSTQNSSIPVKLYGLLPKKPTSTTYLRTRFLADPTYAMWTNLYLAACENIEIREKEAPQSLELCINANGLGSAVPLFPGIAACCALHHLEHIQNSLKLSRDVCEIEREAAVAYGEWLAHQENSGTVFTRCFLKEVEHTKAYIAAIQSRLDFVKLAQLAYNGAQQELEARRPSDPWPEVLALQRAAAELPQNIKDILTLFPARPEMSEEETQQEQARLMQLSRHELELEKVHPERIEFLRYMFETYTSGAQEQGRRIQEAYARQKKQQECEEEETSGSQGRARGCRRIWLTEKRRQTGPAFHRFCSDVFQCVKSIEGNKNKSICSLANDYHQSTNRRSRHGGGQQPLAPHDQKHA